MHQIVTEASFWHTSHTWFTVGICSHLNITDEEASNNKLYSGQTNQFKVCHFKPTKLLIAPAVYEKKMAQAVKAMVPVSTNFTQSEATS